MGDEEDDFAAVSEVADELVEEVRGDVGVDGAEDVVEEVDVCVGVERARERDALLLPAAERQAFFTDFGLVAVGEFLQVLEQGATAYGVVVANVVKGRAEKDVLLERGVANPGSLRDIGNQSGDPEGARDDGGLAEKADEQAALARAGLADDGRQRARFEVEIDAAQEGAVFVVLKGRGAADRVSRGGGRPARGRDAGRLGPINAGGASEDSGRAAGVAVGRARGDDGRERRDVFGGEIDADALD
mmetsp:Transcript_8825/g.27967  ORF Transcript_8825/g.27967 Transcript_8825/m.27967 type:complete len:245 (+) Transcript_8825:2421-3155(+)